MITTKLYQFFIALLHEDDSTWTKCLRFAQNNNKNNDDDVDDEFNDDDNSDDVIKG